MLQLSAGEYVEYHQFLQRAREILAPNSDLSKAAIHSAFQAAIFHVVDSPGTRSAELDVRVKQAVNSCRAFIEKPPLAYECWLEIEGLDNSSLPAQFGDARFVLLGEEVFERLAKRAKSIRSASQGCVDSIAEDLCGRPVAVQRVHARDPEAALALAMRKLNITLECLNFFADLIPYNQHVQEIDGARQPTALRIGAAGPAISVQVALAADGPFRVSRQATKLGTFSIKRVQDLRGLAGEAAKRVEMLVANDVRSPVEELLLRATRWVGRATASETPEDRLLFAEIALECLTRPGIDRHTKDQLVAQTAAILDRNRSNRNSHEGAIDRLYKVRSEVVHDGNREIVESDSAEMYEKALSVALSLLTSVEVEQIETLDALDQLLQSWVSS